LELSNPLPAIKAYMLVLLDILTDVNAALGLVGTSPTTRAIILAFFHPAGTRHAAD